MVSNEDVNAPGIDISNYEGAWHRIKRKAGHWALMNYGIFAVTLKDSGQYIGEVGLSKYHRAMGANFDLYDEASWFIALEYQGMGYAYEAVLAAHKWHSDNISMQKSVCMIHPDNSNSIKLATKLGYTEFAQSEYNAQPVLLFARKNR